MTLLSLRQRDAQILYLGLLHGEARPARDRQRDGRESRLTNPIPPLRAALEPELTRAVAEIDVPEEALPILGEALGAAINELKQLSMTNGRSMVPGFAEAARRFFPEIVEEPGAALDVVGHGVMLRRRLTAAAGPGAATRPPTTTGSEEATPTRRTWSRLWRR